MSSVSTEAPAYVRHAIHGEDRTWTETNCYTDLLIELVHSMGHDPVAMLPFTLAIDFEGDQWTFFKPSHFDLVALYGLDVQELAIWKPPIEHVAEQVARLVLAARYIGDGLSDRAPEDDGGCYGDRRRRGLDGVLPQPGLLHRCGRRLYPCLRISLASALR